MLYFVFSVITKKLRGKSVFFKMTVLCVEWDVKSVDTGPITDEIEPTRRVTSTR